MHEFDLSVPDQRNQMAAEYVLGTLDRDDKAQFELLLAVSSDTQREVQQWREHLDVLNDSLEPIAPPKHIWASIKSSTQPNHRFSWWGWQTFVGMSFAILLAVGVVFQPFSTPENVYAHLIKNDKQEAGWVMNASLKSDEFVITCLKDVKMPKNTVYEAWLMVKGQEPVSLGILPDGTEQTRVIKMKPEWRDKVMKSEIIVTMEGPQGAPDGYNMGPVSDRVQWKKLRF